MLNNLENLLAVAMLRQILAELSHEVLNSVWSRTLVEDFTNFLTELLVLLLRVEAHLGVRLINASEELVGQDSLILLLKNESLSSLGHTRGVLAIQSSGVRLDTLQGLLSLVELLLIVHLLGLGSLVSFHLLLGLLLLFLLDLLFLGLGVDGILILEGFLFLLGLLFFFLFLLLLVVGVEGVFCKMLKMTK